MFGMEGSGVVSAARERKRCSVIKGIPTCVVARHRRTLTCAKWKEGKRVFD
jgi:hypothetical protein